MSWKEKRKLKQMKRNERRKKRRRKDYCLRLNKKEERELKVLGEATEECLKMS